MKELNPHIRYVAEQYKFSITQEDDMWVIVDTDNSRYYGFYWSSNYNDCHFFWNLEDYFRDKYEPRY